MGAMLELDSASRKVKEYLGMSTLPVGIKLMHAGEETERTEYDVGDRRRPFCYFVHEAALGHRFLVRLGDFKCVNADLALGLREPRYAHFEPRIHERIEAVRVGPLADSDLVMLILNPEQVMTAAVMLEGIQVRFGRNRTICGDCSAGVYNTGQPRLTFLCIGPRTTGGFGSSDLVLSMPYQTFLELPSKMGRLAQFSRRAKESLTERLLLRLQ